MLLIKRDLYHIYSLLMPKQKYPTKKHQTYVITLNVLVEVITWDKLVELLLKELKNINRFAMPKMFIGT